MQTGSAFRLLVLNFFVTRLLGGLITWALVWLTVRRDPEGPFGGEPEDALKGLLSEVAAGQTTTGPQREAFPTKQGAGT